jgi:hypothetical protein
MVIKTAKIKIKNVGINFGTYACLYVGKKRVYVTRTYPYGFDGAARMAAEMKAEEMGLRVTD